METPTESDITVYKGGKLAKEREKPHSVQNWGKKK